MAAVGTPLTIARRGGLGAVRVDALSLACSWGIGEAGTLSGFVRLSDLRAAGLPGDLRGMWVEANCGAAGRWGGVVTSATIRPREVEVGATGWAFLASGRVARRAMKYPALGPAALLRRLLSDLYDGASFLRLDKLGSEGTPAALDVSAGDDVGDLLARVASGAGVEWRVDADRRVELSPRLGRDLSGSVRLVEGRHFGEDWSLPLDLLSVANRLVGFGADPEQEQWAPLPGGVVVEEPGSVGRVGPREVAVRFPDVRGGANLMPRLRGEVAVAAFPSAPLQLGVWDVDGVWGKFREGDAVRVVLGSAGVVVDWRVMTRAWEADARSLSVAGDAYLVGGG